MNAGQLRDVFRREVFDLVEPFLWSDEEVYGFLDEAQEMFCRLTDGLADARTDEVTLLEIPAGARWVALHPRIKKIRAAVVESTGHIVPVLNLEDAMTHQWRHDGTPGPLRALILGEQEHQARCFHVPDADVAVRLSVFRLPLTAIADEASTLEIDPQHHRGLLHWVKHRAYSKPDTETLDKQRARDSADAFYAYCDQAKREQGLARHKPRSVTYGGL